MELFVSSRISSILARGMVAFRPRPFRTFPSLANPSEANQARHAATVAGLTRNSAATRLLAIPSAANSNALARCTSRTGAVCDLDNTASTSL